MKYLFCIGAQKAGTTYLYNLMKQHPALCSGKNKETYFFSKEHEYIRGIDSYKEQFPIESCTQYCIDFTPEYLISTRAVKRISRHFGSDARIIVLLRDPVKRAFSQYRMRVYVGREGRSFRKCVNAQFRRKRSSRHFVARGRYIDQLDSLFRYFDKEQVLLIKFEELVKDTEQVLARTYDFLGIEKIPVDTSVDTNPARNERPAGFAMLFNNLPYTIRRRMVKKSRLLKKVLDNKKYKPTRQMELDHITRDKLSLYYKEYNQGLTEKYGIDTSDWT